MQPFAKHGLTGKTKQHVFDSLFERQQGRCFICGISQTELERKQRRSRRHWTLVIDHCHTTGMIRGLLCEGCNLMLGDVENFGFKPKPATMRCLDRKGNAAGEIPFTEEAFTRICDRAGRWLNQHKDTVLLYMQQDQWLPRENIIIHLQGSKKG